MLTLILRPALTAQSDSLRYLALGDSYTVGEGVPYKDTYPALLVKHLAAKGLPVASSMVIARTGWTTTELSAALDERLDPAERFDLVTLLIGVNDQYRRWPIEAYPDRFEALLQRAIVHARDNPDKVIVLSIPDYGYTPFGQTREPAQISSEIDAYNQINLDIAGRYRTHYIDITPISRLGLEQSELVANDRLHPSAAMYALWAELLAKVISQR